MAKMFDKVSQSFLDAIKGVVESTAEYEKSMDAEKKKNISASDKNKISKLAALMKAEKKPVSEAKKCKECGCEKCECEKEMDESVEQIDEVSKATLGRYINKAKDQIDAASWRSGYRSAKPNDPNSDDIIKAKEKQLSKRHKGISTAVNKLTKEETIDESDEGWYTHNQMYGKVSKENWKKGWRYNQHKDKPFYHQPTGKWHASIKEDAEQIDELSKKTLRSYTAKAVDSLAHNARIAGTLERGVTTYQRRADSLKQAEKRKTGINRAVNKLTKEEAEQIDEISTKLATDYTAKAADASGHKNMPTKKLDKRYKSIALAHEKIRGRHANVPTTEEIDPGLEDELKKTRQTKKSVEGARIKLTKGWGDGGKSMKSSYGKLAKEEVEQIDELSKKTLGSYVYKAANQVGEKGITAGLKIGDSEDSKKEFKTMGKRQKGIAKAVSKLTKEEQDFIDALNNELDEAKGDITVKSKSAADAFAQHTGQDKKKTSVPKDSKTGKTLFQKVTSEEVELDEARGRPKKAAAKDFTIHPRTKEKLMHNNPEHMARIEKLQKHGVLEKPKTEAGQHIINQLRKASTSMQGGATVHFTHGESKHVSAAHAGKALDKYASMKPNEKEDFQKKISHSHEQMMKHI